MGITKAGPPRAVSYCRVSDRSQARHDKVSLADQRRLAEQECERRGWVIGQDYCDAGISGQRHDLENREALHRMLADAKAGRFDVVVIYNSDRLGRREDVFHGIVQSLFYDYRVPILDLSKPLQIDDPRDFDPSKDDSVILNFGFSGLLARLDQSQRTRRLEGGKLGAIRQGRVIQTYMPFGYRWDAKIIPNTTRSERIPVIDPDQYWVLEALPNWVLQDKLSNEEIARKLQGLGVKSPGGGEWRKGAVGRLIHNSFYAGIITHGQYVEVEGRQIKQTDPTRITKAPHPFPHPWTAEQWQAMLAIKHSRNPKKQPPRTHHSVNPLAGLARCGDCGAAMTFRYNVDRKTNERRGKSTLVCGLHNENASLCRVNRVDADEVMAGLVVWLDQTLATPLAQASDPFGFSQTLIKTYSDQTPQTETQALTLELNQLDKELDDLERQHANLKLALRKGMEYEEYSELVSDLERDRARYQARRQDLMVQLSEVPNPEVLAERLLQFQAVWQITKRQITEQPIRDWSLDKVRTIREFLGGVVKVVRIQQLGDQQEKWQRTKSKIKLKVELRLI